jgi:hypothetical protein
MRAAGLLGALAAAGTPVDRADGTVVEAYPAAALKRWGLPHRCYKRAENQSALGALVDALLAALPDLHLPAEQDALCRASDDALDAVVCALIARAAALGLTDAPPPELRALAEREGWIAVPGCSLRDLLDERVRER